MKSFASRTRKAAAPRRSWHLDTYRRFSVDIHIPDWDPAQLSRFDARRYIGLIAGAGFKSMMHYTNSHVGLALWNTRVGRKHKAMGRRDFFGEVVRECRRNDIHPIAYFSVGFDNWGYEFHPDWRIANAEGTEKRIQGRYGNCCFNAPGYREYVTACIREIVGGYDVDGIFFDMTFWPAEVCYCPHCTARCRRETGGEPPRVVNWDDPAWVGFQKRREAWLLDFAHLCTDTVKAVKPQVTAHHQFSTVINPWEYAVPLELVQAADFASGDFYGGLLQHSIACKTYHSISKPGYEMAMSRTRTYTDHVTIKPFEEIRCETFISLLNHCALLQVDYINENGTLNEGVYEFLKPLNAERAAYEPFLGGHMLADVGVYYDKHSNYDPDMAPKRVTQFAHDGSVHLQSVFNAAKMLAENHIPFGIVTNLSLDQLDRFRVVWLPNVLELTPEQAERFRSYVKKGGILFASGVSSYSRNGGRFLLEDVLGVRHEGVEGKVITFATPVDAGLREAVWPQDHIAHPGRMVMATALKGTKVLAEVTMPFVDPTVGTTMGSRFGAIHSNPPALTTTGRPAISVHAYGKGRAVWLSAPLENSTEYVNKRLLGALIRQQVGAGFWFEAKTHPCVEMTLFDQPERKRLVLSLLPQPAQFPATAVGAEVSVRIPAGRQVRAVRQAPTLDAVAHTVVGGRVVWTIPPFDHFRMFVIELG